jgi:hypothetical protein
MKIRKATTMYTLSVPTRSDFEFFSSSSNQMLYFRTHEEATLFQKKHYPELSVNQNPEIAILDMDEQGKYSWILIKKMEDLSNPKANSSQHTVSYKLHPSLEKTIKNNPSTVITVTTREKNERSQKSSSCGCATDKGVCDRVGHFKSSSSTAITYDEPYGHEKDIEFLYVSGQERWIIEQDKEITLTDTSYLIRERDIAQLRSSIEKSEQKLDELLAEQQEYQLSTNQF